jgi:restriction endonuclease S subunit
MPRGDKQALLEYDFNLPDLHTQQHIVDLIGTLDDKIENNQEIIKKIEQLALIKISNYLVNFKNAEPMKRHIKLIKGVEPGGKAYLETQIAGSLPFIRGKTLENRSYDTFVVMLDNYPTAKQQDILIALDGATGRTTCGLRGVYSSGIRKAINISKFNLSNGFIYWYLKSEYVQNIIAQHSVGRTTIAHAGMSINDMQLPINSNLKELNEELGLLYKKVLILIAENEELFSLKQQYLKKFF